MDVHALSGAAMSDGTVRRYILQDGRSVNVARCQDENGNIHILTSGCEVVSASDYDALRTQARELAEALKESRREICPFMYGSPQELAWLQNDKEYQQAQAVLKEG